MKVILLTIFFGWLFQMYFELLPLVLFAVRGLITREGYRHRPQRETLPRPMT